MRGYSYAGLPKVSRGLTSEAFRNQASVSKFVTLRPLADRFVAAGDAGGGKNELIKLQIAGAEGRGAGK